MILSSSHKFIFFAFNKTGTTSIEEALSPYSDAKKQHRLKNIYEKSGRRQIFKHIRPLHLREILDDGAWDSYRTACFVRNPFDRIVSLYHYHRQIISHKFPLAAELSFAEWVDRGGTGTVKKLMSEFAADEKGKVIVEFIGRFEHMEVDFNRMCAEFGISGTLPRLKVTDRKRDYRAYYTAETKERVERWVKPDLDMFGYGF